MSFENETVTSPEDALSRFKFVLEEYKTDFADDFSEEDQRVLDIMTAALKRHDVYLHTQVYPGEYDDYFIYICHIRCPRDYEVLEKKLGGVSRRRFTPHRLFADTKGEPKNV